MEFQHGDTTAYCPFSPVKNTQLLVYGGVDDNGTYLNVLHIYNTLSDTWTKKDISTINQRQTITMNGNNEAHIIGGSSIYSVMLR